MRKPSSVRLTWDNCMICWNGTNVPRCRECMKTLRRRRNRLQRVWEHDAVMLHKETHMAMCLRNQRRTGHGCIFNWIGCTKIWINKYARHNARVPPASLLLRFTAFNLFRINSSIRKAVQSQNKTAENSHDSYYNRPDRKSSAQCIAPRLKLLRAPSTWTIAAISFARHTLQRHTLMSLNSQKQCHLLATTQLQSILEHDELFRAISERNLPIHYMTLLNANISSHL